MYCKLDKLDRKYDELDKLRMSSMSFFSVSCVFDELAKLGCKYGDLDELKRNKWSRVS